MQIILPAVHFFHGDLDMLCGQRFTFTDSVAVVCVILIFAAMAFPIIHCSAGRSREAVCRNNLKLIGVGLELWKQHADCYPFWDMPGFDSNPRNLCPWLDLLAMQNAYTAENIEAQKDRFTNFGLTPDDFIKTIEDNRIFMCPSDHPHPHRINKQRSDAWNFSRYEYSYALNAVMTPNYAEYDPSPNQQVLSSDGLWNWSVNLSGRWVMDPNAHFDTGGWYGNTVGYWHKKYSANFLLRDLHAENHKYPPDTTKIYILRSGESLDGMR